MNASRPRCRGLRRRLALIWFVVLFPLPLPAAAQQAVPPPAAPGAAKVAAKGKTDIVELKNGDRITCEIRTLDRGKLTVKTDGMGTLSIEWDDVERVTSTAAFDVELESGQRVFGTLARSDSRTVEVLTGAQPESLRLDDIVRMARLGGSFWRRLDGNVDAGFNFAQANVQTDWTLHSNVAYRGRLWLTQLTGDSALTSREDAESQTRNTLSIQAQRFLGPHWSAVGVSQSQQNKQLALNLRQVLGGGLSRIIVQTNRTALTALGGVVYTTEKYSGEATDGITEAVASVSWGWFTFDGRSTNFSLGALTYYALTGDARVRLELNSSFKSDIVGDLYWSLNLAESYNSHPPDNERRNDAVFSAAVGWSF